MSRVLVSCILISLIACVFCDSGKKSDVKQSVELVTQDSDVAISSNEIDTLENAGTNLDDKNISSVNTKTIFTDERDGKVYKSVKIGSQIWMAENLNYVMDSSWCYDNLDSNCIIYGRLYTWDAAMEACPEGWHLPSREEWDTLIHSDVVRDQGIKLRDPEDIGDDERCDPEYDEDCYVGVGIKDTSHSGFLARAGGRSTVDLSPDERIFQNLRYNALWWTSTSIDNSKAYCFGIIINPEADHISRGGIVGIFSGYSVRCLKDEP